MFDVVVIGSGLAGVTAALAAKRAGASVAVASRSWGATALSTGALDVAYSPALSPEQQLPQTLAEHVMDIIAHRPNHPYGVLDVEAAVDGLRRGHGLVAEALAGVGLMLGSVKMEAENLWLPSSLGALLPAATAHGAHLGVDFARPVAGRWGVVQLRGDTHFDAERLCAGIAHDAEALCGSRPELTPIAVSFDGRGTPVRVASRLDDDVAVDALIQDLSSETQGLAGLIVPPVLGLRRHGATRQRVQKALGLPVVEALAHMPSVPGIRLQRALDRALEAAGIACIGEVASAAVEGERVRALRTSDDLDIGALAVVLATGRFIAGGVVWHEQCREALFGLPVASELGLMEEDGPGPVVRETPVESHPLMTAGVMVGSDLRPIREGRVAFENLFAAGMVLGGFASRYVLCADGVAVAAGVVAGEAAAEVA